jgi:hypothetical protein
MGIRNKNVGKIYVVFLEDFYNILPDLAGKRILGKIGKFTGKIIETKYDRRGDLQFTFSC